MLPCLHFGMNRQCFDAVRLAWPAYDVKIALSEKIALLLHPHVDVPCSLVVTQPDYDWQIVTR